MKKIYISGKITGDPIYRDKFNGAEEQLRDAGYDVINPASLVPEDDVTWNDAMKVCIAAMMGADGIATLPDWFKSRGARLENKLALDLEIPTRPLYGWLGE